MSNWSEFEWPDGQRLGVVEILPATTTTQGGSDVTEHAEQLRLWAKGLLPLEAGTELLIRGFGGKFVNPGMSWIKEFDNADGYWIDFEAIEHETGMLSGGERRFLLFAASLAEGVEVKVGDCISGLDMRNVRLVLAALAHAAGMKNLYSYPPL